MWNNLLAQWGGVSLLIDRIQECCWNFDDHFLFLYTAKSIHSFILQKAFIPLYCKKHSYLCILATIYISVYPRSQKGRGKVFVKRSLLCEKGFSMHVLQ